MGVKYAVDLRIALFVHTYQGMICVPGRRPPKKKRLNEDSDTDSDDIAGVLSGLRRQTQDDFLNSDTSFFVQRAIAAGTAVIQDSRPKKSPSVRSEASMASERKRKVLEIESDDDDDIVITKYLPGNKKNIGCEFCPKCNRRKLVNLVQMSPGRAPRKTSPNTGTSPTAGKSSASSSTITKADLELRRQAKGFQLKREKLDTESITLNKEYRRPNAERVKLMAKGGTYDSVVSNVKVSDYEVIELAAEHTDKSSVLLIPAENTSSENLGISPRQDRTANENSIHEASFWQASVEKLFQFFNPNSSPKEIAVQKELHTIASHRKSSSKDMKKPEEVVGILSKSSKENSPSEGSADRTVLVEKTVETIGKPSSSVEERPMSNQMQETVEEQLVAAVAQMKPEGSDDIGKRSAVVGEKSGSLETRSETGVEMSNCPSMNSENGSSKTLDFNSNSSKFPLSPRDSVANNKSDSVFLKKKAVLEAVIDRAREMKNPGKELIQS